MVGIITGPLTLKYQYIDATPLKESSIPTWDFLDQKMDLTSWTPPINPMD